MNDSTRHIICFSKGHASALVAIEVARRFGTQNMILINHNINPEKESADTKRFGYEIAAYLGLPITFANYGGILDESQLPDQFDVCIEKRGFKAPNTSDAFCTYKLKTEPFYKWLEQTQSDQNCIIYYGYEPHETARKNKKISVMMQAGWVVDFPLMDWERTIHSTNEVGISPPLEYDTYKHANCKGCLKAGIQHWYVTFVNEQAVFIKAEETEDILGYTILRKSIDGKMVPFSLRQFRPIFEAMKQACVPASEHYDKQEFKKAIAKYGLVEINKYRPCDCSIN